MKPAKLNGLIMGNNEFLFLGKSIKLTPEERKKYVEEDDDD